MATAVAVADSVRLPIRSWSGVNGQNVSQARKRLATEGLRLPSDATSPAERQARSRVLKRMEHAGLLSMFGETRAHYVRLTALGDAMARRLVGLPGRCAGWFALHRIKGSTPRADGWTPETCLCSPRDDGKYPPVDELHVIELLLAPALSAGWLECASDYQGHGYLRVTSLGLEALKEREPADDDDDDAVDLDARELYGRVLKDEGHRLGTSTPDVARDIGCLPLPVSCPS